MKRAEDSRRNNIEIRDRVLFGPVQQDKDDDDDANRPKCPMPFFYRTSPTFGNAGSGFGCDPGRNSCALRSPDPHQRRAPVKKSRNEGCELLAPALRPFMKFPPASQHLPDMLAQPHLKQAFGREQVLDPGEFPGHFHLIFPFIDIGPR